MTLVREKKRTIFRTRSIQSYARRQAMTEMMTQYRQTRATGPHMCWKSNK